MSAILESALDSTRKAAADAWDAKARAAMVADAKRVAARTPFDELVAHIESARAIAASLSGNLTDIDALHDMLDEALGFARRECWPAEEPTKHDMNEEFYMEQARGF